MESLEVGDIVRINIPIRAEYVMEISQKKIYNNTQARVIEKLENDCCLLSIDEGKHAWEPQILAKGMKKGETKCQM